MIKKNICIITQGLNAYSETFIKAHIDLLKGNKFILTGWAPELLENDIPLKHKYTHTESVLQKLVLGILPYHLTFKIKQKTREKWKSENLVLGYLKENKIDLVLAEYGTTGAHIAPFCKQLNIPLIVHFHGFDAYKSDTLLQFSEKYKYMFEYASKIIGVSKHMCSQLIKLGCPPEKVVYNIYGANEIFATVNPDYKSNNLLAVGRFAYKKAPYLTILAFKIAVENNPNLTLTMIGDGELFSVCQNMVNALHLENSVYLKGALQPEEIREEMAKSFCFIQHSITAFNGDSEGTPVSITEACTAGLPVISTYHAGIPDIIIPNQTGLLVQEGDITTMAAMINQLANNRQKVKEMGQITKQNALENYSMKRHIDFLDDLIHESLILVN